MSLDIDVEHARGSFRLAATFAAQPGVTALFGRSGSGKSTLVDIVAGLIRPQRGRIVIDLPEPDLPNNAVMPASFSKATSRSKAPSLSATSTRIMRNEP